MNKSKFERKLAWYENRLAVPWYLYLIMSTVIVGGVLFLVNYFFEENSTRSLSSRVVSAMFNGLFFGIAMRAFYWINKKRIERMLKG